MPIATLRIDALVTMTLLCVTALLATSSPAAGQDVEGLSASWTFEPVGNAYVEEHVSEDRVQVVSPNHPPEWVEGVDGSALRFDGYTTHLSTVLAAERQPTEALTAEAWVAIHTYPAENAPIVNQYRFPEAGYYFGMDPWGRWYLAVSIGGEWYTGWAEEPFPTGEWVHVAGTFDSSLGIMHVYLDGEVVGTQDVPAQPFTIADEPIMIGRDLHTPSMEPFEMGLLNGLLDHVKVYRRALSHEEILASATQFEPPAEPALEIPSSRFQGDPHRPGYHAIPPANWTNEPHGLVYHEGTYHMFYQKNPNGPYWARLKWGHMTSTDLAEWTHQPIALSPEPGWDQHGVWSGDAVVRGGVLTPVYTGVDGVRAGVGIAQAEAGGAAFLKHPENPLIPEAPEGTLDFRDPFVWEEDGTWHMLIGSGFPGAGGSALHYTSPDLEDWSYRGAAFTGSIEESGVFWEMPVLIPLEGETYMFGVTTVEEDTPARALYWLGAWDGQSFVPHHEEPRQLDLINHLLSPTVTQDVAGRHVAIGIIPETRSSMAQYEAGWAHTFSLPREWGLCEDGEHLCQRPAPELQTLRGARQERRDLEIAPGATGHLPDIEGTQLELHLTWAPGTAEEFGLVLRESPDGREQTRLSLDLASETIRLDLRRSSLSPEVHDRELHEAPYPVERTGTVTMRVFIDQSVLEVYIDDRKAFATRIYPTLRSSTGIDVFAEGGTATLEGIEVWEMDGHSWVDDEQDDDTPDRITLGQNYPNPFHADSETYIPVELPREAHVRLDIFDVGGRTVATLLDGLHQAGRHVVEWDGRTRYGMPAASGVYLYRLQIGENVQTRAMVMVR